MTVDAASTVLLIRATRLDDRVLAFAETLREASGHPVSFVLDERHGPVPHLGQSVIGITDERCQALGLYCPPDYAWRCGDYGYYLARQRFPAATLFWMIEYDVRFCGDGVAAFFASFAARPEIDLLATFLGPAGWDWYWAITSRGRNVHPARCLFPVTRLSSRAIDALLGRRVAHSRNPLRRYLWPNDEAMVATTLCHGDFLCRDLNDFGVVRYDATTFTFTEPIDGDTFRHDASSLRIYHPVLFGDQYRRKMDRLQEVQAPRPAMQGVANRVVAKLNSLSSW